MITGSGLQTSVECIQCAMYWEHRDEDYTNPAVEGLAGEMKHLITVSCDNP